MGQGVSREELVYQATQKADVSGIKRLRQDGAGLEWQDSHGRTSLIIACSRADMLPVARLLLQLGADVNAYVRGAQGGTAIHQAARKGLDQTVQLLLDYGADPLRPNDIGRRALDIAWEQHRPTMARIIEDRVALFIGYVRQQQLSGPAFLQALVPQWVTKKVWVAVVPGSQANAARQRLNIYASPSAPTATEVLLHHCRVYLTKQDTNDPMLVVEDMQRAEKYKFTADRESREPGQIQKLYNACQGIPQRQLRLPVSSQRQQQQPSSQQDISRQSAGGSVSSSSSTSPTSAAAGSGRGAGAASDMGGWAAPPPSTAYAGWDSGPSTSDHPHPFSPAAAAAAAAAAASASAAATAAASTGGVSAAGAGVPPSARGGDRSMGRTGGGAAAGAVGAGAAGGASDWGPSSSNADSYGGWGPAASPAPAAAASPAPTRSPPPAASAPVTPAPAPAVAAAAAAAPVSVQEGWYQPPPVATAAASAPIPMPAARAAAADVAPSAPPLSPPLAGSALSYPTIDTTPITVDYSAPATAAAAAAGVPAGSPNVELHPSYDPERVQAELKRAESNVGTGGGQCVICWDARAEAVCVPCGHVAGCMECLGEVKGKGWGCPVCRANIQQVVKLFHV
ncbi:hypothetical protein CLOP_g22928 [Closterium sp. NIES-67]|nr:hypothetical protein CLOP_g22928 [Closterium sp. NIES-67]